MRQCGRWRSNIGEPSGRAIRHSWRARRCGGGGGKRETESIGGLAAMRRERNEEEG